MTEHDATSVIREHASFVWRVLRHLGVAEAQLEDLSQQVFLITLRQLPTFKGHSSLRTWLFGICRNVAQQARRDHASVRELPTAELPEHGQPPTQENHVWLKQAHAQLVAILSTLSEDQRNVFVLYEIEELSMDEISALLDTPTTTCYSRLTAARRSVESELRRRHMSHEFRLLRSSTR